MAPNTTKIGLFALLAISLVGISLSFTTKLSFRDSSIVLTKGEPVKILPGETITQTFIPQSHELSKLEFLVRNPEPKSGDLVTVTLADANCQTPLRESVLEPTYLDTDNLFVATFDPLPVSSDQPLCAILRFDQEKYESKFLRFFTEEYQSASLRELAINGVVQDGQSLSMRPVYHHATLVQDLSTLGQRISQYKPWFLKDIFLGIVTTLFLFGTIVIAYTLVHISTPKNPTRLE